MSRTMKLLLIFALAFGLSEAGFRCTFGDWACSAGCVTLGQSSGYVKLIEPLEKISHFWSFFRMCDDDGKCWCSERSIDWDTIKGLLPSRCDVSLELCQGSCHALGFRDGACMGDSRVRNFISFFTLYFL